MERVEKGKKYYTVIVDSDGVSTWPGYDWRELYDNEWYASGNYYASPEEAEAMAKKIRKVLEGADVIEMPSNEIIVKEGLFRYNKTNDLYCAFKNGVDWLKSKTIK